MNIFSVLLALFVFFITIRRSIAQFCATDEVPSGISIDAKGRVMLHCSRALCSSVYPMQTCDVEYAPSCNRTDQWVGGIPAESNLETLVPLECCTVKNLDFAVRADPTVIVKGGAFNTKKYTNEKKQIISYDIIKNIKRLEIAHNSHALRLEIVRLHCKDPKDFVPIAQLTASDINDEILAGSAVAGEVGVENSHVEQVPGGHDDYFVESVPAFPGEQQLAVPPQLPVAPQPQMPLVLPPQPPAPVLPQVFLPAVPAAPLAAALPAAVAGGLPAAVGAGGPLCFSEDMTVETISGQKLMKDLKIGDRVLTKHEGILTYSPITTFLHRLPEKTAKFHEIRTSSGRHVILTPKHLIYVMSPDQNIGQILKRAESVTTGERLVSVSSDLREMSIDSVVANKVVEKTGAYAPLTGNDAIFVNGLLASCHSVFENEKFMSNFVRYAQGAKRAFDRVFGGISFNDKAVAFSELPWFLQYAWDYAENLILLKNI